MDGLKRAAAKIRSAREPIKVVSHLDADGICSAAILSFCLQGEGKVFALSIVNQLTEEKIMEISKEDYKTIIFSDLGAGQVDFIKKHIRADVVILDHHLMDPSELPDNIIMVNPHLSGFDGSDEISGAGVCFLFAEEMGRKYGKLAYLAVIGALGDVQRFDGLNKAILEKAANVRVERGLRWFGLETKPLHSLLTYNTDFLLPGITGSESAAVQFLIDIGIEPKKGDGWVRFNDLTEEQRSSLVSAIIMKRSGESEPGDILGERYILTDQPESTPFRDARQFATLLNACGRMEKPFIGVGAALNDPKSKEEALRISDEYRAEIVQGMRWYDKNDHTRGENYLIINAGSNVKPTIIGTIASILSNTGIGKGTFIMSMASIDGESTKVSLRAAGDSQEDLRDIINSICAAAGGESGGHANAAGAVIKTADVDRFIEEAVKVFRSRAKP